MLEQVRMEVFVAHQHIIFCGHPSPFPLVISSYSRVDKLYVFTNAGMPSSVSEQHYVFGHTDAARNRRGPRSLQFKMFRVETLPVPEKVGMPRILFLEPVDG